MFTEKPFICFFGDPIRRNSDEARNPRFFVRFDVDVCPVRNAVSFTVRQTETSDVSWFSVLLHGMTKETSPDDFAAFMESGLDKTIADIIGGRKVDGNDGILTEQDLQWLGARRYRASSSLFIGIGLALLCAAVPVLWICRFFRMQNCQAKMA